MTDSSYSGPTLDDVMRWTYKKILGEGEQIYPRKGPAKEVTGVVLEISNPLARVSRTETRGRPFSCLGELCWYLSKTNKLDFIEYYVREYRNYADGDEIFGGYGPRLFSWKNVNQFDRVVHLLKEKRDSRQAVIQLFDALDLVGDYKDVPCTCTLQFMVRQGQLHLLAHMRSNDAFLGLPHDIFCFTMLQEIMAKTLGVQLGMYKHMVGSLHIYDKDRDNARLFLNEGWQPTANLMKPMPEGDPWPAIEFVLSTERAIRLGDGVDPKFVDTLDGYWADIVRLLLIFRALREKDVGKIQTIRDQMSHKGYHQFIDKRIGDLSRTASPSSQSS